MEDAKKTLVRVVERYKNVLGKSTVDQRMLLPDEY